MEDPRFAKRMHGASGNVVREILKLTEQPDVISFGGGLPSPDSFPVEEVREIADEVLASGGPGALQYSASEGYWPLREYIAGWVARKGIKTGPENVLITSGSQQGIDLSGKTFLNPGDRVAVESPTYLALLQIFGIYEATFVPVGGDDEGVRPDLLEEAFIRKQPKLLYLVPTFQNPTGQTHSLERRKSLMNIINKHETILIEDEPYASLRYDGTELRAMKAFDEMGNVIHLGSFSKIVAPGLRVGYAIAPTEIFHKMVIGKQVTDVHTSNLSQRIVYEFCKRGLLEEHIRKIISNYSRKRDLMLKMMEEHFPAEARWAKPQGGLFLWVTLPEGFSTTQLLRETLKEKVAFIPGNSFFPGGGGENTMRLNFSNASPESIEIGIARLGRAIKKFIAR